MSDEAHREAQELLPWFANGSLAGTELERVQAHLRSCAACRADLATLHTLRAAGEVHGPAPGLQSGAHAEAALARLLPELDAAVALPRAPTLQTMPGWRARLAANDARWLRVALALQCCVIAVLAGVLLRPAASGETQSGPYRALGTVPGAQGTLVVRFKPEAPERELRRIVLESGARVVGGPTVTGAWMLGTTEAPATVAARLRAQPAVTLAEALGAGEPP